MQDREFALSKDEWSCIRLAYNCPQKVQSMAPYITKKMNNRYSVKKIRRILAELREKGYLNYYDDRITKKGADFYRKYESAWYAICSRQHELELSNEEAEQVSDYLVSTYSAQVLKELGEKFEADRALNTKDAKSEIILNTDFCGRLPMGIYKVAFDLICRDEGNGVYVPCSLGECFLKTADLIIEPLKSRLELKNSGEGPIISGAVLMVMGEEVFLKADQGVLSIPVPYISFEHVPSYKILQGSLELWLITEKGKHKAGLELPLLSN